LIERQKLDFQEAGKQGKSRSNHLIIDWKRVRWVDAAAGGALAMRVEALLRLDLLVLLGQAKRTIKNIKMVKGGGSRARKG